jgi:hypothetical protein
MVRSITGFALLHKYVRAYDEVTVALVKIAIFLWYILHICIGTCAFVYLGTVNWKVCPSFLSCTRLRTNNLL